MSYGYGRKKAETHEKSMGSYVLHAWRDAMAIADLLDEEVGITKARKIFETLDLDTVMDFEKNSEEVLSDFIKRSESQRPTVLKKLKSENQKVMFLTLAIIGCVRVKELIELRDAYRYALAPGGGNRVTTASIYMFGQEVLQAISASYHWPSELIQAMGLDDDEEEN